MKKWFKQLSSFLHDFCDRNNDWMKKRILGFAITALTVGMTTACLSFGVSPIAVILGVVLSSFYCYWYERSFQFWNGTPFSRMLPIHTENLYFYGYTTCPQATVALLGIVAFVRATNSWYRALGVLGMAIGLDVLDFYLRLLKRLSRRCEEADEIVNTLQTCYRHEHDLSLETELKERVATYAEVYYGTPRSVLREEPTDDDAQ